MGIAFFVAESIKATKIRVALSSEYSDEAIFMKIYESSTPRK
jgi:hypothetical protein